MQLKVDNQLPDDIRSKNNLRNFKSKFKTYLFNIAFKTKILSLMIMSTGCSFSRKAPFTNHNKEKAKQFMTT